MGAAPVLNIVFKGETIKSVPIEGQMLLGRGEGCVIRLTDRAVSRQHAVLSVSSEGIQIERKSDFAPLSVNGEECSRAVIKEGDVVSIGPYLLKMQTTRAPALAANVGELAPVIPIEATHVVDLSQMPSEELKNTPALLDQVSEALMPEMSLEGSLPDTGSSPLEIEMEAPEFSPPLDENAATRVLDTGKLQVKLIFPPGSANHSEYEVKSNEISIGRAKECDVVLADKKSSRKNAVIRRKGNHFVIEDLDSANGTYVNGEKIKERDLVSEDLVKIGNVEFKFMAISLEYAAIEKNLSEYVPAVAELEQSEIAAHFEVPPQGGTQEKLQIPGMGMPGVGTGRRPTLMERFKAQPKFRQVLILMILGLFVWWYMEDDDSGAQIKSKKPVATASGVPLVGPSGSAKLPPGFDTLTQEQKHFIESQHSLAFDYYKNKEYDRSLFELNKIFSLVPDYQDSREIERYAKEGKRKLEAMEEERKRKEQEEKVKARVAELVEETGRRMQEKNYPQAQELFGEILALDPDNTAITNWKKTIDSWQEEQTRIAQEKQVQAQINKNGWEIFQEALSLKKGGHFNHAISTATKVFDIGSSDKKLVGSTHSLIKSSREAIEGLRDPVLAEAKAAETAGDLPKAYHLYEKATQIDPRHSEGHMGMDRIRDVLHERAKNIYTEAVLAESYSDLIVAKKKYKECMDVAPHDDIYYERAERKLSRFPRTPASATDTPQ